MKEEEYKKMIEQDKGSGPIGEITCEINSRKHRPNLIFVGPARASIKQVLSPTRDSSRRLLND